MEKLEKCKYCGAILSSNDSVFIHINRYDSYGRSSKQIWICCKCWNRVKILIDEQCIDCKYGDANPASYPCRVCGHCYISHFEEEVS